MRLIIILVKENCQFGLMKRSAFIYSGELNLNNSDELNENELEDLKSDIKLDTHLKVTARKALAVLIKRYGWNIKVPCSIPRDLNLFVNAKNNKNQAKWHGALFI